MAETEILINLRKTDELSEKVEAIELIDDQLNCPQAKETPKPEKDAFKILEGHGMGGQTVRYSQARNPNGSINLQMLLNRCKTKPITVDDIRSDDDFVSKYLSSPTTKVVSPLMRAAVVDWMNGMQVLFDGDITSLAFATLLLDSYTWQNPRVLPRDYLKIAVISLIIAIRLTTKDVIVDKLVAGVHEFCKELFTIDDIRLSLMVFLKIFVRPRFAMFIPHYYLPQCLQTMPKMPRYAWEKFVALCLYLLDLGALNIGLVKYSARVKCAAMMCCAREFFQGHCLCTAEEKNDPEVRCIYHTMAPMNEELKKVLYLDYDDHVRSAAQIYSKMLQEAMKVAKNPHPKYVKNCLPPFVAAYNKFKSNDYFNIAHLAEINRFEGRSGCGNKSCD